jgi:hypothetical protein
MTTTAFQVIFDKAESISINKRAIVGQTVARDLTVRSVSRGGQLWRFDVQLPSGIRWSEMRSYLESIEGANRFTSGTIQINQSGYNSWLTAYQGNSVTSSGFVATAVNGSNTITLTTSATTPSGYKFRSGDVIQLGSGHVYTVASDVAYDSNSIQLNRPVLDASASYGLVVGPNVTWTVVCTSMPQWTISGRDQVSFSGAFSFVEVA